jgi:hypothetical protein
MDYGQPGEVAQAVGHLHPALQEAGEPGPKRQRLNGDAADLADAGQQPAGLHPQVTPCMLCCYTSRCVCCLMLLPFGSHMLLLTDLACAVLKDMQAELDQHVDVQSYNAQAAGGQYEQQYDPHAGQQQAYEQQQPLDAQQYDPAQLAQLQEHHAAAASAQQGQDPISALLAAGEAVGDPNAGDGDVDIDVSHGWLFGAWCSGVKRLPC